MQSLRGSAEHMQSLRALPLPSATLGLPQLVGARLRLRAHGLPQRRARAGAGGVGLELSGWVCARAARARGRPTLRAPAQQRTLATLRWLLAPQRRAGTPRVLAVSGVVSW